MIEEYNLSGICFMSDQLTTLKDALKQNENLCYFDILDLNTLGYVKRYEIIREDEFIPMTFRGKYLREVD